MRKPLLCLCLSLFGVVMAGCTRPMVADPLTQTLGGADPDQQLEFWHTLADRPVTSNDEAFHGLLMFLDGEPTATTYEERVAQLKARGLLSAEFDEPAETAISRGTMAVAITKALKIKTGVMQSAFPDSPRYASRELIFLGLYPPSSPNQTFSGSEFLGIIGRMEDWERSNTVAVPASDPAPVGDAPAAPSDG